MMYELLIFFEGRCVDTSTNSNPFMIPNIAKTTTNTCDLSILHVCFFLFLFLFCFFNLVLCYLNMYVVRVDRVSNVILSLK